MKKPKAKEETFLQLDGKIYIVTKKNGRTTKRDEIDGKLVLEAIMAIVRREVAKREMDVAFDKLAKA